MSLPRLVLVCTTVVCVLFVATPMSTISVYCLWPLPRLLLVCSTLVQGAKKFVLLRNLFVTAFCDLKKLRLNNPTDL